MELPILRLTGTVKENPHMRAFWASTCSFFIAFVGWFALAPVAVDVMYSIGQCENQLYKVADHPTRKAFVTFKDIKTKEPYCVHGIVDDKSDCKEIPAVDVLPKCVCGKGTACKGIIANAGIASVGSTVFVRIALGTLLERFGPVNVQSSLLTYGGFWVA